MHSDITVVGAGPAGLGFALLAARTGLRITLVDKRSEQQLSEPEFDGREIALTQQSVRILRSTGTWRRIAANEQSVIVAARVEDGTSRYFLEFAPEKHEASLGHIVSNRALRKALFDSAREVENIDLLTDASVDDLETGNDGATTVLADGQQLESRLIVAADSRFSGCRRNMGIAATMLDFGRVCIVCRVQCEKAHTGVAFECFHYGRTLAVLPLSGNSCSVVITAPMDSRAEILEMDRERFNLDLQSRFGSRLGAMHLTSERFAYPLVGVHAKRFHARRFALIGDAAVGMHPVTAHGFNLGLSGAEILAGEIATASAEGYDIASERLLRRYESRHMRRTRPIYHGTNQVVSLFTDDRPPVKLVRQAILRVSNRLPLLKRAIGKLLTDPRGRPAAYRHQ